MLSIRSKSRPVERTLYNHADAQRCIEGRLNTQTGMIPACNAMFIGLFVSFSPHFTVAQNLARVGVRGATRLAVVGLTKFGAAFCMQLIERDVTQIHKD